MDIIVMFFKKNFKFFICFLFLQHFIAQPMHIEVTIGKNHDWAIFSNTHQALIYRKKGEPKVIIPSTKTSPPIALYYHLRQAIIAGRQVAKQQKIYHTTWEPCANGSLKQIPQPHEPDLNIKE